MIINRPRPTGDILIVDDTPANLGVLSSMLEGAGYTVRPAISGEIALKAVEAQRPDLILLDIRMPGMDGFEVCRTLKSNKRFHRIPIIFISALSQIEDKLEAFKTGGVDYVTKPFEAAEVLARVDAHMTLVRQRQEIKELCDWKDNLIEMVTHNLKTPINIVLNQSYMLGTGKFKSLETASDRLKNAANHMNDLVSALLNLVRIESGLDLRREKVRVQSIVQGLLVQFDTTARQKDTALETNMPEDDIHITTDGIYLKEALANLVSNAIKYTPEQGTVSIEVEPEEQHLIIRVIDNGPGIEPRHLEHVFDKFYRIPNSNQEGTGLGLAISKAVIEQLDGEMWADSEVGQGTVFSVSLPLA